MYTGNRGNDDDTTSSEHENGWVSFTVYRTVIDHGFPLIGGDVGTDRIYGTVVTFYFSAVPAFLSDGDDYGGGGNFLVGLLWLTIALCLGERWNL